MMNADGRWIVLWLVLFSGCAVFDGGSVGGPQQDTVKAVRLKAVLLEAEDLAGSAIDITVDEGHILLEGFVETTAQRNRAEDLVMEHSDIDNVTNQITVK